MTAHQVQFNRALQYESEGNIPMAMETYMNLIRETGGFKEAHINLGSLYARMDQMEDAMQCYNRALEHGEDHILYFNIGSIYYKQRNFKKAIINLSRSRKLKKDFPLAALVMGLSYSRMKNSKPAENCFTDVLNTWPDNLIALTALSILHFQSGRLRESMKFVDRILVLDGQNEGIRKLRTRILRRQGKTGEYACELKIIKKSSREFLLFDDFIKSIPVDVYSDRYGTMDQKIEQLREKARVSPGSSNLISLSLCHLLKGDTDIAIDFLLEAEKRLNN